MYKETLFSPCRQYRYNLYREWDNTKPNILFIGLNPSIADEEATDKTLDRCINFAKKWEYGSLNMANLYAFVDTDQDELWEVEDPIGPENDQHLLALIDQTNKVIVAWGNGAEQGRAKVVLEYLQERNIPIYCLKHNETGMPSHPLYLSGDLEPIPYVSKEK